MLKRFQKIKQGLNLKQGLSLQQAYRQAPWRRQMQMIGFFAAGVASVALLAGLYLNITARAATAGRMVQDLQDQRAQMQQQIEDLSSQLADISSVDAMQQRASELGFAPVLPGSITYLSVQGYKGRPVVQLAPRAGTQFGLASRMPPAYTQSLFDWLANILNQLGGL
jgi:cell division protein FtsL